MKSHIVKQLVGEAAPQLPKLPRFSTARLADKIDTPQKDKIYDEMIAPLFSSFEIRMSGSDDMLEILELGRSGRAYAIEKDAEFLNVLTVPLDQWNAAVTKFKSLVGNPANPVGTARQLRNQKP